MRDLYVPAAPMSAFGSGADGQAEQTLQYTDVRNAGHDGSNLLFVRKK